MELTGLKKADAAIISGGLTGCLLGAALAQKGMSIIILEAGDRPETALPAPASVHRATCYVRASAAHGEDIARQYAQALLSQLHALTEYPLPYAQRMPMYTYARTRADIAVLEQQRELYLRLRLPVHTAPDAGGCPFPVELSLFAADQALVDIHRWQAALRSSIRRQGGRIFSPCRVTDIDGPRIFTDAGCIRAQHIIFTADVPPELQAQRLLLLECRRLVQIPLTGIHPMHSMQQSVRTEDISLCPTTSGLLAALEGGRIGAKQERLWQAEEIIAHSLPDWQQAAPQFSRRVITADGLPVIGPLPHSSHFFAAGANDPLEAMHAASVLMRCILGCPQPHDAIYSPSRPVSPALLKRLKRQSAARRATGYFRIHAPECTHCRGRMRYAPPVALWECPLCGSAFTALGQPVSGPGMKPVSVSIFQRPLE